MRPQLQPARDVTYDEFVRGKEYAGCSKRARAVGRDTGHKYDASGQTCCWWTGVLHTSSYNGGHGAAARRGRGTKQSVTGRNEALDEGQRSVGGISDRARPRPGQSSLDRVPDRAALLRLDALCDCGLMSSPLASVSCFVPLFWPESDTVLEEIAQTRSFLRTMVSDCVGCSSFEA